MRSLDEIHSAADKLFAQFDNLKEDDQDYKNAWRAWFREYACHARLIADFFYKAAGLDARLRNKPGRWYRKAEKWPIFWTIRRNFVKKSCKKRKKPRTSKSSAKVRSDA